MGDPKKLAIKTDNAADLGYCVAYMNNLSKYRVLIGQMYALATAMGVKAEDKWAEVKAFFNSVAYWNFDEKCTGAAPAPATPAKKDDKKLAEKKDDKKKPAEPAKKDRILQAPVK